MGHWLGRSWSSLSCTAVPWVCWQCCVRVSRSWARWSPGGELFHGSRGMESSDTAMPGAGFQHPGDTWRQVVGLGVLVLSRTCKGVCCFRERSYLITSAVWLLEMFITNTVHFAVHCALRHRNTPARSVQHLRRGSGTSSTSGTAHAPSASRGLVQWWVQEGAGSAVTARRCSATAFAAVGTRGRLDFPAAQQPPWEVCTGMSLVASIR